METTISNVPAHVGRALGQFVDAAVKSLQQDLVSAVLFGSAAEGRLRQSSDVNLILVLKTFDASKIDSLREELRMAHAAIRLSCMFLLETEIEEAVKDFAVKFNDVLGRHKVLYGTDPFLGITVPRAATIDRLRQVLMNMTLRLRERYTMVSLREEQLTTVIAEFAGPLRGAALSIVNLEGKKSENPKEALANLMKRLAVTDADQTLERISLARETGVLQPGQAPESLLGMLKMLQALTQHLQGLH